MKNILVRYGELTLKGNNRNHFITKLIQNIKFQLKEFKEEVVYTKDNNSLTLGVKEEVFDQVLARIQNVFGIYSLSIIEKSSLDFDEIANAVLKIAEKSSAKTFKLEVFRKDKSYPITSTEMKQKLAPLVLKNNQHLKVDVHHPELKIEVVIKKDHADIFDSRINALKGLPVGVSGKGLSLLSGGIDSPVASFLTMKRGMTIDFLHFMTPPHTSAEALTKVFDLAKIIAKYNYNRFSLFICNFTPLLEELNHIPNQTYKINIMRRMFVRIANQLAFKTNSKAIITGESLGQVASQTIESINTINSVSTLPILRPVLTYDKEEIIKISKQIGTYETSILPFDDACSMFVPKNPTTKPKLREAEFNEKDLLWEELLNHTVQNLIEEFVWINGEFVKKEEE
ncbi:tRNA uracil 4-sulfurtransferase ThiI [Williamsoniiplasma luminosum]|uniref:Probable tRNA sulfurtransferase n=1 Tax=Williamsoniiplasma luminosum TaxID=214888 RepID=A0A2S0NL41_9MOLU|nr:tRNA uracil 4-sulfurtransferase ThiI [Williamsoniiplasma luminosum]AVP49724.1 MAG: tRNA 4-thiouridine(8) synthase ThiI [Williamsoniiplasma luminosum]